MLINVKTLMIMTYSQLLCLVSLEQSSQRFWHNYTSQLKRSHYITWVTFLFRCNEWECISLVPSSGKIQIFNIQHKKCWDNYVGHLSKSRCTLFTLSPLGHDNFEKTELNVGSIQYCLVNRHKYHLIDWDDFI